MKLSAIQAYVAARILAVPTLAVLGEPLVFSAASDPEAVKATIADRLRATGVCIDIGEIDSAEQDNDGAGSVFARASLDVYVSESPQVTHTPAGLDLVEAVVAAICGNASAVRAAAEWIGYETALSEHGYTLHILRFSFHVEVIA